MPADSRSKACPINSESGASRPAARHAVVVVCTTHNTIEATRCGRGSVAGSTPIRALTSRTTSSNRAMPRRLLGALLIGLMAVGSVLLWIGVPVGWLYLASRLTDR